MSRVTKPKSLKTKAVLVGSGSGTSKEIKADTVYEVASNSRAGYIVKARVDGWNANLYVDKRDVAMVYKGVKQ